VEEKAVRDDDLLQHPAEVDRSATGQHIDSQVAKDGNPKAGLERSELCQKDGKTDAQRSLIET
jgi:hypothetical protein